MAAAGTPGGAAPGGGARASVQPGLEGAAAPLGAARAGACAALLAAVGGARGGARKRLVLDPALSGPLALVAPIAALKGRGVAELFHLEDAGGAGPPEPGTATVYLLRATPQNMLALAAQVRALNAAGGPPREVTLLLVPRRTLLCEKLLEREGVLGSVGLGEYMLDMVPFEDDVVSTEAEGVFGNPDVDCGLGGLHQTATALARLQAFSAQTPAVMSKGPGAAAVVDMALRMLAEGQFGGAGSARDAGRGGAGGAGARGGGPADLLFGGDFTSAVLADNPPYRIDRVIVLDREVDPVTPFCTQLTYEGLIDEVYGIQNGIVELGAQETGGSQGGGLARVRRAPMNSSDGLFRELRDMNFAVVGKALQEKARTVKEGYKGLDQSSISNMKDFVKKLNRLPEMQKHTEIAERLTTLTTGGRFLARLRHEQALLDCQGVDAACEYAEELMFLHGEELGSVLKLLCLVCATAGGIPKRQYEALKRAVCQCYGFEHVPALDALHTAGYLRRHDARSPFPALRKALRLVIEDLDDENPDDCAYAFSGYAPISCRLVEWGLSPKGWQGLPPAVEEAIKGLPGPLRHLTPEEVRQRVGESEGGRKGRQGGKAAPVALVVLLGGATFAEINALRFLKQRMGREIVVLTTKLVNGKSLLAPLLDVPKVAV